MLGLLNSAVAADYYLRILVMMSMHEPSEATERIAPMSFGMRAALVLPGVGTLFLGILPSWVLDFAGRAAGLGK